MLLFPAWYCPWSAYACSQRFQFGRSLVEVFDVCSNGHWRILFHSLVLEIHNSDQLGLNTAFCLLISVPLSSAVLHAKFTWKHIASAALAVFGVVILVFSDASTDDDEDNHLSTDLVVGDFIVVRGAFLLSEFHHCRNYCENNRFHKRGLGNVRSLRIYDLFNCVYCFG